MEETDGTRERIPHYYFEDGTDLYIPYWVESATAGTFDRRWEYNWNQLKTRWVPLVLTTRGYLTQEPAEPLYGHVITDNYSVYSEQKRMDDAVFLRSDNNELRRKRTICTCFFIVVGLLFVAAFLIPVLYTILSPSDAEKTELLGRYSIEVKIVNLKYRPEMGDTSSPLFRQVTSVLEEQIDYLYMHRSLNKSYYGCNVTGLSKGSVIAKYDLYFRNEEQKLQTYDAVKSTLYTAERDEENKTLGKLGEYRFIIDSVNVQDVNIVFKKDVDAAKRESWADITQRLAESTDTTTKSPTRVPQTKSPSFQSSGQSTLEKSSTTISTTKISAKASTTQSPTIMSIKEVPTTKSSTKVPTTQSPTIMSIKEVPTTKSSTKVSTTQSPTIMSIKEVPTTKSSTKVPTTNKSKETIIRKSSTLLASSKSNMKDLTTKKGTEVPTKEISHEAPLAMSSAVSTVVENQTEKPTTTNETKSTTTKAPPKLQIIAMSTNTSASFTSTMKILIEIPKSEQSADSVKTEILTAFPTTKKTTSEPTETPTLKTITEDVSRVRPSPVLIFKSTTELSTSTVSHRYVARSISSDVLTMISPTFQSTVEDEVLPSEIFVATIKVDSSTFMFEASPLRLESQETPQMSSEIPARIWSQSLIAPLSTNTISGWLVEKPYISKNDEVLITATPRITKASRSLGEINVYSTVLVSEVNTLLSLTDKDYLSQISEDHLKERYPQFMENVPRNAEQLYSSRSTDTTFLHSSMPDTFSSLYTNVLEHDNFFQISILSPLHVSTVTPYSSGSVLANIEYSFGTDTFRSVQPSSILPHFHAVESAPSFSREKIKKDASRSTDTEFLSPSKTKSLLSLRRTLISKDHFAENAPVMSPESSMTENLHLSNSTVTKTLHTSSRDTSPSVHYISLSQDVSLELVSTIQDVSYLSRFSANETLNLYREDLFPAVYYTPPIQDSYLVESTAIFGPESTQTETKHKPRTTGTEMPYVVGRNITSSVADSYLIKDRSAGEFTPSLKGIMELQLESTAVNTVLMSSLIEGPFLAMPPMTIESSLEQTKLSSKTYRSKLSILSGVVGYSRSMETYSVMGNKARTATMFESVNATSPSTSMSLDYEIITSMDWISYSSGRQPFTTYYPAIKSGAASPADFLTSTKRLISDSRDLGIHANVLHTDVFVASEDTWLHDSASSYWEQHFQTISSSFDWLDLGDFRWDYTPSALMFAPTVLLSKYSMPESTFRDLPDKQAVTTIAGKGQPGHSDITNISEAVELPSTRSNKTHELLSKSSESTIRPSPVFIDYYYDTESLQWSSHSLFVRMHFSHHLDNKSSELYHSVIQDETDLKAIQTFTFDQYTTSSTDIHDAGYPYNWSNKIHVESDYLKKSLSSFYWTKEMSFYPVYYWTSDGFQSSYNDFFQVDPSPSYASRSHGSLFAPYDSNATQINLNTRFDIIPTRSVWKVDGFSSVDNVLSSYTDNIRSSIDVDMYYSSVASNTLFLSPASRYNDHKDQKLAIFSTSAPSKEHSVGQDPLWSELIRPTTSQRYSSRITTFKHLSSRRRSRLHTSSDLFVSKRGQWLTESNVTVTPQATAPFGKMNWTTASFQTYMSVESVHMPRGIDTPVIENSYSYDYESSRSLMEYGSKSPDFLIPWSGAKVRDSYPLTETTYPSLATPWINPLQADVTDVHIGNESSLTSRYSSAVGFSTSSAQDITLMNRWETSISVSSNKQNPPSAIIESADSRSNVRNKWIFDSSSYVNVISPIFLQTETTTPENNFIDSLSDLWFAWTSESSVAGHTILSQTASSSLQPDPSISWEDIWAAWTFESSMEIPISVTSTPITYATNTSDTLISDHWTDIWSDWFFTSSSVTLISSAIPLVTPLVRNTSTVPRMPDSSSYTWTTWNFDSITSEPSKSSVVYLTTSKTNSSVSFTSDQWADIWSEWLYDSMSINSTSGFGSSVAYMTPNTSVSMSTVVWEDIWSGWTIHSVSINPSSALGTAVTSKMINTSVPLPGDPWANIVLNDWIFNSLSINPAYEAIESATPALPNISNSLTTDPWTEIWNNWRFTPSTLTTDIATTGMTTGGSLGSDASGIGMGTIPSWIASILGGWAIETLLDQATSAISPSETVKWPRGSESSVFLGDSQRATLTTRSDMMEITNSTPVIRFDEYNSTIIIGENARIACSASNIPGWSRVDVMRFPSNQHRKVELIGVITSDGTLALGVVQNVILNWSILHTDNFTIVIDFNPVDCADDGTYMVRVLNVDTVVLEDRTKVAVQAEPRAKLLLPAEMVSGRWLLGITCDADLGYPPGRVIFQMKGLGQKEFVEFVTKYEVTNTTEKTGCLTRVTYKFDDNFQPNHEWNMTTFRCAIVDTPALSPESNIAASNEEVLQFLPSDVCNRYPGLRYIPHPFDDCKRYISCPSLYILSCDPGKCFDKSSSSCTQATEKQQTTTTSLLRGTTADFSEREKEGLPYIRFSRSTYSLYIGEIENISCTVGNMKGWKTIRIFRMSSRSGVENITTVTWPDGTVLDGSFQHVSLSGNSMAMESGAFLEVEFKNVQCSDAGTYTCTVEGDQGVMGSSNASVTVLGKPTAALVLPVEIVEGRWVLGVRCTANIGYPPGRVIWQKRGPNQKEFAPFITTYRMYNTTTTAGCLTQVTYTFDDNFSPNVEWDFTELKCAVTDTPAIQEQSGLVVSNTEILKFVPANVCDGVTVSTRLIPHPYSTCELYINCPSLYILQCPADKCFDTPSQTCVLK